MRDGHFTIYENLVFSNIALEGTLILNFTHTKRHNTH